VKNAYYKNKFLVYWIDQPIKFKAIVFKA